MIRAGSVLAAVALACASVPAQAGCWNGATMAAARLHEFHVRLSVAELRCGAADAGFTRRLNAYASRYAAEVTAAENHLRPLVASLPGAERRSFENYSSALANRYGGDSASPTFCGVLGDMLVQLTEDGGTVDDLHTYALMLVREPLLETRCPAVLASSVGAPNAARTLLAAPAE